MKTLIHLVLLALFLLVPTACSGGAAEESIPAQTEIITLQLTPALEHWLPKVASCAGDIPYLAVITQLKPADELSLESADLVLRLGEREDQDPYIAVLGQERTIILAGPGVPITALGLESLQQIFTGEINIWSDVPGAAGLEKDQAITVLTYPEGHELRLLFEQAYLDSGTVGGNPLTFSTETYLAELLSSHPAAIAYTLESLLPPVAQTLAVRGFDAPRAQHNVLAITQDEPMGKLRQLLLCLQD